MRQLTLLLFFASALSFDPSQYTNSTALSPEYNLYWKVVDQDIFLALEVRTLGWVGFGIAEPTSGSMPGADILTGYVVNGVASIQDRHSVVKDLPPQDDCANWVLVGGEEVNGKTVIEVTRKLNTGDVQDRVITGYDRIIWAYGASDTVQYHGTTRKAGAVWFFGPAPRSGTPSLPYMDFINTNYTIPSVTTTYHDVVFPVPMPPNDVHVVVFDTVIAQATKDYIHHFVLSGCTGNNAGCQMIWGWAPGVQPLWVPEQTGFRFGPGANSYKYIRIQIHYDNPSRVGGRVDSSGVRLYYTTTLRQYDAGVLELGDPAVTNPRTIPQGSALTSYEYNCPSECTALWPNPITVWADSLHMHQIGAKIWGTHWRDGQMLRETNRIEFWDFGFQQQTPVSFTINPGDRINTHCIFAQRPDRITTFSQGSTDEMCIEYLYYYPRLASDICSFVYFQGRNYTLCAGQGLTVNGTQPFNPSILDPPGADVIRFGAPNPNSYQCPQITQTLPLNSQTTPLNSQTSPQGSELPVDVSASSLITSTLALAAFLALAL